MTSVYPKKYDSVMYRGLEVRNVVLYLTVEESTEPNLEIDLHHFDGKTINLIKLALEQGLKYIDARIAHRYEIRAITNHIQITKETTNAYI